MPQDGYNKETSDAVYGTYKDDDSRYSLRNLLNRQETETGHEE